MESIIPEKKKRGRKSKNQIEANTPIPELDKNNVKIPKKRGRKPKGGKIIIQPQDLEKEVVSKMNIILHLKCNLSDIDKGEVKKQTNKCNNLSNQYSNYNFDNSKVTKLNYTEFDHTKTNEKNQNEINHKTNNNPSCFNNENMKNIWLKLEKLSSKLHCNNICNKKSACFFCTFDFDNVPIFIPKHELNNIYYVYGCFCSPECACAFLMDDKTIDSSTRFERYYLLNFLYCKIYNYNKNIKPAPNPFYTLNKYYGNLSIQEYRQLLKNERMLLVIDKPLSRLLPELYDDSDDFFLNSQNISTEHKYNLQDTDITKTKNDILNNHFNLKN